MKQTQNSKLVNRSQQNSKKASLRQTQPNTKQNSLQLRKTPQPPNSQLNKRIVSPQKLKILVLSGNELQNNELDFLSKCINLIKLDLSHNHITKLHQKFGIHKISNLRVLNLQANKLCGLEAIEAVFGMESLQVFSYNDNPLEENPKASHFIVNGFPNLKVINYRIIFVEQRDPFFLSQRKNEFISNDFEEWQPAQHSEKYYLRVLKLQLEYVDNMWMYHNPIVKIQRIWRAILEQNQDLRMKSTLSAKRKGSSNEISLYKKSSLNDNQLPTQKSILKSCFRQWKTIATVRKAIREELNCTKYTSSESYDQKIIHFENKKYLTYELHDYYLMKRNLKIKHHYQKFLERIRFKLYMKRMVQIFRRNIKLKQLSFADPVTSYYKVSGLDQSKKVYFNRVQQHLIENFLAHIAKNFNKHSEVYSKGNFAVSTQYVAVRLMDPDTYYSKTIYNPLTYLLWPCMRSVILKKKKFPYKQKSSIIKLKSLSYIRNLNKRLTPQEVFKANKTYSRIDKFFQHEYYESLGYFQCEDEFVMKQLIRMIFYHNTKALKFQKIIERSEMMSLLQSYTQNVSIYTQKLLQRTTSAVKIQQQWRKYINNKKQKQSIYEKLKKNRASRLIQRFIRDRIFYHRLAFQRNLSLDLAAFDEQDLLIHQQLYKMLPQIIQDAEKHIELYKGIKIQIKDTIKLYHDDFNEKQIFSPKLRSLHLSFNSYALINQRPSTSNNKVDIYKFFHQGSNVKIIECKGQKFYQFTFSKVEDAKIRVACLALLTYRMYGSQYLLLLSKSTLHMYNQRIKNYKNYNVHCRPFVMTSQEQNFNKLKINVTCDITLQSNRSFIYLDLNYESSFSKSDIKRKYNLPVEFYQKRFQDFPQKYISLLKIILRDEGDDPKEKEIEQKFMNIKKLLIKESQVRQASRSDFERVNKANQISMKDNMAFKTTKVNIITPTMDLNANQDNFFTEKQPKQPSDNSLSQIKDLDKIQMSLIKTSQKHLSLYEVDNSLREKSQFRKSYKTLVQEGESVKRNNVAKFLQSAKQKKEFFREKKQIDLGQVREKRKMEKVMNMTLKSFNQTERTQVLRKKAQKIKEFKRRSLSSSKADEVEFMQQGNFIMEQQLKMNLMRNRIKQAEKLKQKRNSISKVLNSTESVHNRSQQTKSIRSNQSLRQKKMLFEGKDIQILELDKNILPSASMEKHSNQIFGGQTQVINKRSYVKKRSAKVGAYLRDPSLVHGVFPEQYYPIESGKGGITFPRVV